MPKLVAATILLVVVLGYALAFVSWNVTPVPVVGLKVGADAYWDTLPIAYLPLIGVGIGLVAMALLSLGQWLAMKGQVRKLSGQVAKAREVIDYQKRRIAELETAVDQLRREQERKQQEPAAAAAPAPEPAADLDIELSQDAEGADAEII